MKTITVKVDAQGFPTVSDDNAGSCGEHNNLTLKIEPNTTFFQNCEYYKLNIDGRYSERLTQTGSNLEYTVPQAALCPPEINCQVVGFKTVNQKSVLICRTKTFKLKVEPSPGAYLSINTDVFEPLETAIAHCGNMVAAAEEQIAELGAIAGDLTTRADEIEAVAKDAISAAETSKSGAEAAASSAESAKAAASAALESAALAESTAQKMSETTADLTADIEALKETAETLTADTETLKETTETLTADTATLKETTKTLTADTETLKETTKTLTDDVEKLKYRVNVAVSGTGGGSINKIFRELYLDFSSAETDYTASNIDIIKMGRNVNGRWFIELGDFMGDDSLITFSEDSERYDVITAQNADGVKAYAVIDWSELLEGAAPTYYGVSLNSVDEVGAWPAIYAYINGEKIKETISGGGTGEAGFSPFVNIAEIENGHRVEITDAEGLKSFDVLNGKDGVGITKIEHLTDTESSNVYAIYLTDGTYTPINIAKGKNGADGYTPQRGVDYFTAADKQELVAAVISALPKYEGEVEAV